MKSIIKFFNKLSLLMVKYFIQNVYKIQKDKLKDNEYEYEFKY